MNGAAPGAKLLDAAEEARLARRMERGDPEAKERMIESNLRLVHAVARTYRGSDVPYTDLVQEGTVGLIRAVERFDHRRGLKFSTYAVWCPRPRAHRAKPLPGLRRVASARSLREAGCAPRWLRPSRDADRAAGAPPRA